jgi:hypothetical protein
MVAMSENEIGRFKKSESVRCYASLEQTQRLIDRYDFGSSESLQFDKVLVAGNDVVGLSIARSGEY